MMKLWIDDVRPAPEGYIWAKSVNEAKEAIIKYEDYVENLLDEWDFPPLEIWKMTIDVIDIDHDAGDFSSDGEDYMKLLDWLEKTGRNYPIHIHSMNVVGRMNMEAICKRNNWTIID